MSFKIKTVLTSALFILPLIYSHSAYCTSIWDLARSAADGRTVKPTYQQAVQSLSLLTEDQNFVQDPHDDQTYIVAGGYIVLSPTFIRSYKNQTDYNSHAAPEFEYEFNSTSAPTLPAPTQNDLSGVRIVVDMIPVHQYWNRIGQMTYTDFVSLIQTTLKEKLHAKRATVETLRTQTSQALPTADQMNAINANPPHLVISTQFNNDGKPQNDPEYGMTTFCVGNIMASEFPMERQRARFIEAALTGKSLCSVKLGACITKACMNDLGVKALSWDKAYFANGSERTSRPIPVSIKPMGDVSLVPANQGNYNGITLRNLIFNGYFSQAAAVPFPDMFWVENQIRPGREREWINRYADAITQGILAYVNNNPEFFSNSR